MKLSIFTLVILACVTAVSAQTSAFTYQGKLSDGSMPASGPYDLTFRLYTDSGGTTQIGTDQLRDDVQVAGGIFTVTLDFGSSPFTSATGNYLQISVRPGASTGAYTPLSPLQQITSSPYSISTLRAQTAATADNSNQLGGVNASQYVQTTDARMSDARTPTAGSADYIQNTTSPQATSNFNISGTGSAGIINVVTQYNIGGTRIMSKCCNLNMFVGENAGAVNSGSQNSFFGSDAGKLNTSGNLNSFFGRGAGGSNNTASNNSFYGAAAGAATTTGFFNSFFGSTAGQNNVDGFHNSFFGGSAGQNNSSGSQNSFFGINAGTNNTVGSNNTFVGWGANPSTNNLNNATAIGASATVSQSNSLVLGNAANVGIGTTAPLFKFHVRTGTDENFAVRPASVFGGGLTGMGIQSVNDANSAYKPLDIEGSAVTFNIGSGGRVGIGITVPPARLSVVGGGFAANAYFSDGNPTATTLDVENTSSLTSWRFQTNGNGDASRSGNLEVWKVGGVNGLTITPSGNVGMGTLTPNAKLEVGGVVQSTSGGFKFPDATIQTTAASNLAYTAFRSNFVDVTSSLVTIAHIDIPAGTYLFEANIHAVNIVDSNFRTVACSFTGVEAFQYQFTIPSDGSTGSMHMVATVPAVGVDLQCLSSFGGSIRIIQRRLTAIKISDNISVQ